MGVRTYVTGHGIGHEPQTWWSKWLQGNDSWVKGNCKIYSSLAGWWYGEGKILLFGKVKDRRKLEELRR